LGHYIWRILCFPCLFRYELSKGNHILRIIYIQNAKLDSEAPASLRNKIIKGSAKEKELALNSLKKLGEARIEYYEAGFAIHELALRSKEIYQSKKATTEEKRILLSYIFSNLTQKADRLKPNYTLAFEFLVN
jgi:hypothetical protein